MKFGLLLVAASALAETSRKASRYCSVLLSTPETDCEPIRENFANFSLSQIEEHAALGSDVLEDVFDALLVLQQEYYSPDYGTWPTAIDWTAAVAQTLVTGTLTTLSKSLEDIDLGGFNEWKEKENLIASFYNQVIGSYFSQDVLSIRGQAYDDILWVVLGWLEALKFVSTHSRLHYSRTIEVPTTTQRGLRQVLETMLWHGHSWATSFAHRARIFWNVGSHGWDERLCHGGMNWNPRLTPYKNAITNELWVAASISMYQYFPGDNFTAPWLASTIFPDKDPAHLAAAVEGHRWLMNVNMTNSQGLFVDGYHVDFRTPGNTECDMRDEMVYTYNQGVILTGLRGLWTISGASSYLQEGHGLIQSVISATGWSLQKNASVDDLGVIPARQSLPTWHGIGRGGILEERCDASGTCSQDGQTFKAIFFHHLSNFCDALEPISVHREVQVDVQAYQHVKASHVNACRSYLGWIQHNAAAAVQTRDSQGRFGMWWGASLFNNTMATKEDDGIDHSAQNTTDYRNYGTPKTSRWGGDSQWLPGDFGNSPFIKESLYSDVSGQQVFRGGQMRHDPRRTRNPLEDEQNDPNERGRGRTIETQLGGLALLRAYWEISQSSQSALA